MACGGPCTGDAIIFFDDYRVENYMYTKCFPENDLVIFRKNEQFDSIYIRNLLTGNEVESRIDTCISGEETWLGDCNIDNSFIVDSFLIIENSRIDSTLANQEINIIELLE